MLKVKNLSKKIGNAFALQGVNFCAQKGELLLFLGHSGAGKSTLLRTLCNLEDYEEGVISYNGHCINNHVGMVFQHFNLFEHLTVERNITLPLEKCLKKTKKEATETAFFLLDQYGLLDKAKNSVLTLSGGEKQRLAIARTLSLNPQIICFDEPTSALDPLLATQIRGTLEDLCEQGKIVLVATHDMTLASKLKKYTLHFMKNGSIVESCKSDEFYKDKESFPSMSSFLSL